MHFESVDELRVKRVSRVTFHFRRNILGIDYYVGPSLAS